VVVHAFEAVTFFGNASTLAVFGLAVAFVLCALSRWSLLSGWAAAIAGTGLLNTTLKGVVRRLRPHLPEPWVTEAGWSFPSGHAIVSLVAYGFVAYLITRMTSAPFPRWKAIALLATLVLLIGFSRVYLGVHFLSDVIGGYAAAAVWLTFCILITHRTQARGARRNDFTPPIKITTPRSDVHIHTSKFQVREVLWKIANAHFTYFAVNAWT
jgi:membrane-associated phospholipid phosphatase